MPSFFRLLGTGLCACALSLSGCRDSDPPPSVPDSGTPEPGPLIERGDYVDVVPKEPCMAPTYEPPPGASCSNPSSFSLSGCDMRAVGAVEPSGVYQAIFRYNATSTFSAGFRLDTNPSFLGRPLVYNQVGPEGFFITGQYRSSSNNSQQLYALAGCRVPEPGRITGCFVRCTNNVPEYVGTFDARRMNLAREAPTGAQPLRLVSETDVPPQGDSVDVYVTKGHAYVVSLSKGAVLGGLSVFNVSDPAHPVLTKTVQMTGDSYWNGVWAKGDALYVASGNSGVAVFDITDPANPVYLRSLPGGGPIDVHTVFVDGDRLYAMSPSPTGETLVFDVASPLEPQLLSRLVVPHAAGSSYPHDAFAYGDRLYVNHTVAGYKILDLKRPDVATVLGTYSFQGNYSHANAVGTIDGRTIAFEGGERFGAHLRVLDVTDPANIRLIGEVKKREHTSIHNMVLKGTRLYVAWYHEGVRVFDVSKPEQPKEIASFDSFQESDPRSTDSLYQGAIGIRVPGDGYVYVVDMSRGLLVLAEP
ncbi:LVIVD repeat-containing protein [Corallococcus interemptor]|uniref:LVIVD repeat-containing protein n=1 Tax=Corallococcus interemptor TaxID=2316720 RepID=UPI003CFE73A7